MPRKPGSDHHSIKALQLRHSACAPEKHTFGSGGPKPKAYLMTLLIYDQLQSLKLRSCLSVPTGPLCSSAVWERLYSRRHEHTITRPHPANFTPPKCTGQARSPSCSQIKDEDMCRSLGSSVLGCSEASSLAGSPLEPYCIFHFPFKGERAAGDTHRTSHTELWFHSFVD